MSFPVPHRVDACRAAQNADIERSVRGEALVVEQPTPRLQLIRPIVSAALNRSTGDIMGDT